MLCDKLAVIVVYRDTTVCLRTPNDRISILATRYLLS